MDFITSFLKGFGLAILCVLLFLSIALFGLVLTIDQTVLNREFTASQVEKLDVASVAKDIFNVQILPQATVLVPSKIKEVIDEVLDDTIADLEPWMKQQAKEVTYSAYDYLEGSSQHLNLVIPVDPVKESLRDNIKEKLAQSPLEITGLSASHIERYIDGVYEQIPSTFEFGETTVSPQLIGQLEQIKQFIRYSNTVYLTVIGFILLLIALVIVIKREVRGSTRLLGATFLLCGIFSLAIALITPDIMAKGLSRPEVPVYLQVWIPQLLPSVLAPLKIYGIGSLVVAVILLTISFVYKRGELHAKSLDYSLHPEF
jgi:hypothetical protein